MSDSSIIRHNDGAVTFAGSDAVHLYRATVLVHSLRGYAKLGMLPTRGVTITKMLAMASSYTGKKYKRGAALEAAADVDLWCKAMQAALPIVSGE
jgi:hypothetical protein